jgi:transposase
VRYKVSRKTGYKWIDRMEGGGRAALRDWSRARHHGPHRNAVDVAERICVARQAHPS